jgi:hypothetical protein
MGFIGSIGNFFKGALNAVKSFASSGFGQTLIGMAGAAFGPIGSIAANVVTGLIANKGKLTAGSLLNTALGAFSPLISKFNLGGAVNTFASALKNPTGLLGGLSGLLTGQSSLGSVVTDILKNTGLDKKIGGILQKATGFLGKATGVGGSIGDILNSVTNIFGQVGVQPPQFLGNFSQGLSKVLGALDTVNKILQQFGGILNPAPAMIRA